MWFQIRQREVPTVRLQDATDALCCKEKDLFLFGFDLNNVSLTQAE